MVENRQQIGVAKGEDIEKRLVAYAVRIVRVCVALPRSPISRHLVDQLLRSGTAPAALYAEARTAESRRDFIHKMRLALKELNESRIWLDIILQSELVAQSRLTRSNVRVQPTMPHPQLQHPYSAREHARPLAINQQPLTINYSQQETNHYDRHQSDRNCFYFMQTRESRRLHALSRHGLS